MSVPVAAVAATSQRRTLSHLRQIGDHRLLVLVQNLRAGRHPEDHGLGGLPAAVLPHAMAAARRLEVLLVAEVDQRVEPIDRLDDYVSTAPTVAAVRPAELDELLAPKGDAAVPAVAAFDKDFLLIEEFHGREYRLAGR